MGLTSAALTKAFWALCALVVGATLAFPLVTGYGTSLFQAVVGGAWSIVAAVTSDAFADLHKLLVWSIAALLSVTFFSIPAVGVLFATRGRPPVVGATLLIAWFLFYAASLFIFFPATDGP